MDVMQNANQMISALEGIKRRKIGNWGDNMNFDDPKIRAAEGIANTALDVVDDIGKTFGGASYIPIGLGIAVARKGYGLIRPSLVFGVNQLQKRKTKP